MPELNAVFFINVKNRSFDVNAHITLKTPVLVRSPKFTSSPISTWMGDPMGIPGAQDFFLIFFVVFDSILFSQFHYKYTRFFSSAEK